MVSHTPNWDERWTQTFTPLFTPSITVAPSHPRPTRHLFRSSSLTPTFNSPARKTFTFPGYGHAPGQQSGQDGLQVCLSGGGCSRLTIGLYWSVGLKCQLWQKRTWHIEAFPEAPQWSNYGCDNSRCITIKGNGHFFRSSSPTLNSPARIAFKMPWPWACFRATIWISWFTVLPFWRQVQ